MHPFERELDGRTDEDIIALIQTKELDAMDYMLNRYKYLVRKKAKALYLIGGDKDDLIQEGMIGLYKAIRDFNKEKYTSFFGFADMCISRQMYTAIKSSNRKKNLPLNTYVSLYSPAYGENADMEEKESLIDLMYGNKILNPEQLILDKERSTMLEYELVRHLSSFEKTVLDLYLQDYTYVQIAEQLDKEPKSIDNALQRIRAKLNTVLKKI